jgi:hypothetical protein
LLTLVPAVATAQVQGGDQFQVNTYTTDYQGQPAVAVDADGDFVVVWTSLGSSGTDPDFSVQGRRFASDGSPVGDDFQVNTFTTSDQGTADVAMSADGDFVVVWRSRGVGGPDSYGESIQGQRYAADGTPLGNQFLVNTYVLQDQRHPAVAADADGNFVVVWTSVGSSGTDQSGASVQGQRYAADGSPLGGEFQVNTYTTTYQGDVAVAVDPDGDFVVVWNSFGSAGTDSDGFSIQGQRYAADGSPLGAEFQVNTFTDDFQERPGVSFLADGGFLVVWESEGSAGTDSSGLSVQGQRFGADGTPLGGEFQINSYTTSDQADVKVATGADGNPVVVWASAGSWGTDFSSGSVQARSYAVDGQPKSGELQVNQYITSSQARPAVSVEADGHFVVTWWSLGSPEDDSSGSSIQARRFNPVTFADGFESGDTSAWSSTVP